MPSNYEIISSSIANGVEGLDSKLFAELQDSNYSLTSWKNGRYDGSIANNRRRGIRILGLEPSLTFDSFNSFSFPLSASNDEIRGFYSTFEDSAGSEKGDTKVYYNKYESQLLGDVLTSFSSFDGAGAGSATMTAKTNNSFSIQVDGLSQGLYNYSGSIGELIDGGEVEIDVNVDFDYWSDDAISGSTGNPTPSSFDVQLLGDTGLAIASASVTFDDATFVEKVSFTDTYNYKISLITDVVTTNAVVKFSDESLYEDSGGTTGVGFNFNTIKKSNFIPVNNPTSGIVAETPELKTFFYEEVPPSPSNPNGYDALTQKKFYRLDTGQIYSTNDLGIVTNIE